jgi:hypothetical protein
LANREGGANVLAEIDRFESESVRSVTVQQLFDLGEEICQPVLWRSLGTRLHDAAVERHETPGAPAHNSEAGIRDTGVDSNDDHLS